MTYETLLKIIENENIKYIETNFPDNLKGLCKGDKIGLDERLTASEKACILAEELGHYYTSVGNILDQSKVENRKQERRARVWGYDKLIPLRSLIDAYKYGCHNKYETADFLDVTEEFLSEAISYYLYKYGKFYPFDKYIIYFEPLAVFEQLNK